MKKFLILSIIIGLTFIAQSCGKADPYKVTGVAITDSGESLLISDPLIEGIELETFVCLTNVDMKKNWKISNQCDLNKITRVINSDSVATGLLIKAKLIKKL